MTRKRVLFGNAVAVLVAGLAQPVAADTAGTDAVRDAATAESDC